MRRNDCPRWTGICSASAGSVLDEELLAKPVRQPLTDQARHDVGHAAGGKADDDADRLSRIILRTRDARHGRESGSTGRQMQKLSASQLHKMPP
jgi:hypothetical protein